MLVLPDRLDRRFEAVVVVGQAPAVAGLTVLSTDEDSVGAALAELWEQGIPPGDVLVLCDGGPHAGTAVVACVPDVPAVLDDQLRRRADLPEVHPEVGWGLDPGPFDAETERVAESLLAVGDGRVGTSGAPLARHPSTRPSVLVAGVYDGDGTESRLLSAPVVLQVPLDLPPQPQVRRVLDLRTGLLREDEQTDGGPLAAVRFAALHRPGTVVLRASLPGTAPGPALLPPLDGRALDEGSADGCRWMRVAAPDGGIAAAVHAGAGSRDVVAAYTGDPDQLPSPAPAVEAARAAASAGFEQLLGEQRRAWAARWRDADISIERDADLQLSTRLALFHLMGSVATEGEAAVGARGITGPGYRGHVFWDADTFVLPFLAATHPAAARSMLEYRIRRLPRAAAAARAQSRDGARYPWESARTGDDVTPLSAYDRGGRLIPVRTGGSEVHIVAEVAWATCCYLDWTGDRAFAAGGGLRLLVETARYWASRVEVDADGSAHLRGVIGPDEYHEDVDDDAFTNVMARWNLRRAADAVDDPATSRAGVGPREAARWRDLAAALVDGWDPEHGRHEQFSGFGLLEPLVIAEVAPRRPIAADVLMGRERIQASQVVKQPDVLMLHHLVPQELRPGSLPADLAFYEPRTAHGSSLSPGVHAALLARVGRLDRALKALEITARIDLDDLTGSTASGVHLATAGALWQALVMGFAGIRPVDGRLAVDPHVPPVWGELGVRVRFRGTRVVLRTDTSGAELQADGPLVVDLAGTAVAVGPDGLRLQRTAAGWEVCS